MMPWRTRVLPGRAVETGASMMQEQFTETCVHLVTRRLRAHCVVNLACVQQPSCWPRRVRYVELITCMLHTATATARYSCWLARAARHKRNSTSLKQNRFGSASPLFDAGVKLNRCRRRQNSRVPARCVVASLKSNAALSRPLLELVCRKVSR